MSAAESPIVSPLSPLNDDRNSKSLTKDKSPNVKLHKWVTVIPVVMGVCSADPKSQNQNNNGTKSGGLISAAMMRRTSKYIIYLTKSKSPSTCLSFFMLSEFFKRSRNLTRTWFRSTALADWIFYTRLAANVGTKQMEAATTQEGEGTNNLCTVKNTALQVVHTKTRLKETSCKYLRKTTVNNSPVFSQFNSHSPVRHNH